MSMDRDVARQRSLVAVASRRGDQPSLLTARRDLAAAKIADYVKRTVENAPPLTDQQRERLAALLRGGVNDAA